MVAERLDQDRERAAVRSVKLRWATAACMQQNRAITRSGAGAN
jgi:hypothetical protein